MLKHFRCNHLAQVPGEEAWALVNFFRGTAVELALAGSAYDGSADLLGEFSISETGGIDGELGDQTGRESWIHDYYSGRWDGILHYNDKADVGGVSTPTGSGAPSGDVSELAARVIAGDFGDTDLCVAPRRHACCRGAIVLNWENVYLQATRCYSHSTDASKTL